MIQPIRHTQYPTILHVLARRAREDPGRHSLSFAEQTWTHGALHEAAEAWAGALAGWGLEPGDRVALFLGNRPEFLAAYLGILRAKAVVVLVNAGYRAAELRHILTDSGARLCVTDPAGQVALARCSRQSTPSLEGLIVLPQLTASPDLEATPQQAPAGFTLGSAPAPADLPSRGALAILAYTSGTTGQAKGAKLLHGNLISNALAVNKAWGWTRTDRLLLTLPLFHVHGLCVGFNGSLTAGAEVDLRPGFDTELVLKALHQGLHTLFFGVPTMYSRLLALARQQPGNPPPPLRLYVSGSAPLSAETFRAFEQAFGQRILERYGMTETLMNMTNPLDGERRAGTVGAPFPGQQARVVHGETREPLVHGEVGEIQVRGPHVFAGYWRRPRATLEALPGHGWFNTGDLGWRGEDGIFTLEARARELIISGGFNVYPREVEEVLLRHPDVAEAAVVGRPHADLGEAVVAVVVAAPGANQEPLADDLVAWCRAELASFKKPRQVLFVDSLPRNALGKLQKHLI